jgi:tetratricopeptide (TPR) repeat protein
MSKSDVETSVDEFIKHCVVKLTANSKRGTGFFVALGKIITCAHVLDKTPANEINIQWESKTLTVNRIWRSKEKDLVILDVQISDHPCVYLDTEAKLNHKLYSYGYPGQTHDGFSLSNCKCGGLVDEDNWLKIDGGNVSSGLSGAPLLNMETKKVCGIIVQERQETLAYVGRTLVVQEKGGLAIPTKIIFDQYPELEKQQQEFHNNDTRWSQFFSDTPVCLPSNTPYKKFLYSLPEVVDHFQDRHDGVEWIRYFLNHPERVMFLIGREGIGKTQMVSHAIKLLTDINELSENATSDKKEKLNVVNVGYFTLARETLIVSRIFSELCGLLPDNKAEELKAFCRDSKIEVRCKVDKLLSEFSVAQTLVIIDDFDKVLNAENQEIQDQNRELEEILCALRDYPYPHSVKVIIISGYTPRQSAILSLENTTVKWLCGLDSPYGEQYLRDLDQDGKLAKYSDEELRAICERIHGFPIAICALHKTLQLNIVASLKDILNDLDNLVSSNEYGGIIEALIGRVFKSLSASEKQVMQILAVYKHPTLLVAVDYVAKQCQPDINTKAILNSLGDKQLVNVNRDNKEEAFYFLHSIDAEYALSQIKSSNNSLFTEVNLLHHAANYWTATRESLEKSLDSLNHESLVQHVELALAEFDLRYKAEEYDEAATALFSIETSLSQLGQYSVIRQRCELIQNKVNGLILKTRIADLLGTVYQASGKYTQAIDCYESVLKIAQEINYRELIERCFNNLGYCYYDLGNFDFAIKEFQKALNMANEIGKPELKAYPLNSIGACYESMEQIYEAIGFYQEALGTIHDSKNLKLEGFLYNNLGVCYKEQGRIDMAIDSHKQALTTIKDKEVDIQADCGLGNCYTTLGKFSCAIKMYEKALSLIETMEDWSKKGKGTTDFPTPSKGTIFQSLAEVLIDSEQYEKAIKYAKDGLKIGKDINSPKLKIENGCALARCYLYQNNLSLAYTQAMTAKKYEIPEYKYYALGLLGLISLRQGDQQLADKSLREALAEIENVLDKNARNYTALDIKGLSLTALATFSDEKYFEKAKEAYKKARTISNHAGTVLRALRLLHELEIITSGEKLHGIRIIMTQLDKKEP